MGTLVLVYNADADLFSAATDWAHKLLAPSSYACSLCAVTYGAVRMRSGWRDVLDSLDCPVRFLHRDEFAEAYDADLDLPAILWQAGETLSVLVSAGEIDAAAESPEPLAALEAELRTALDGRCGT